VDDRISKGGAWLMVYFPSKLAIKARGEANFSTLVMLRKADYKILGGIFDLPRKIDLEGLLKVEGVKSLEGLINIHSMEGPSYIELAVEKPYFLGWSLFPKIPLITKRPHIQLKRKLERRT